MLKGLTRAGIGSVGTLEPYIQLAAEYGYDSIDVGGSELKELVAVQGGAEEARRWLQDKGRGRVAIGAFGLSAEWRGSEEQFRDSLVHLAAEARAAAALGCTACCTYIMPSTDSPAAPYALLVARRLRTCAQILGAYGIRLGLEFIGSHHLRTVRRHPFLWTIDQTLDLTDAIGEPNVGLLFDSYHWYTNELDVSDIKRLNARQIVHAHINDAPDVPVADALDNARLYPGEGVIDLKGFLLALDHIGYTGVIAQEVLSKNPREGTAEELVRYSKEAVDRVYEAAGL